MQSGLPIVFRNIRRLLCASQMCTSFARTWTSRPFSDPGVGPRSCKKRLFKNKLLLDLCQEIKQHYFSQSLHESFNFQFNCQNFYAFQTNFFPMCNDFENLLTQYWFMCVVLTLVFFRFFVVCFRQQNKPQQTTPPTVVRICWNMYTLYFNVKQI